METYAPGLQGSVWWAQQQLGLPLISIGVLVAIAVYGYLFLRKPTRLPPGPRPWPVVGNLPVLDNLPHKALARLANKYGPLMYLRLGSYDTVVASTPEMTKQFLRTHDQAFAYRPKTLALSIFYSNNLSIALSSGSYLRHLRKICLVELFTQKRIESFRSARTEEITATLKAILEESQKEKVVDLSLKLSSLATNNMSRMLMNKRFGGIDVESKEVQQFTGLVDKLTHFLGLFIVGDYVPYLSWVSKLQGIEGRMRETQVALHSITQQWIDEHRKAASVEKGNMDTPKDFLDVLLTMPTEDGTGHLSDVTIHAVILDMMAGGSETSAVTTEWALAELLRNPHMMRRVQAELDAVVGTTRLVQESDLPNLEYLQAVIKENYRLHPPAPLLFPHESRETCEVAGYILPAKTRLIVNQWAIGRDPSSWERPLEFDPERFMEHPELDVKGQHFQLLPFGTGRRGCPGMPLALVMVQIMLARLVQSFDWSLPNGQDPTTLDMSEKFGASLPRAKPLHVVAHQRLPAICTSTVSLLAEKPTGWLACSSTYSTP